MSLDVEDNLVDCHGNLNAILPLLQVWQVVDGHDGVSRIIHGDNCRVEGTKKNEKIGVPENKHIEFYVLGE
jgi:hypothetical protein